MIGHMPERMTKMKYELKGGMNKKEAGMGLLTGVREANYNYKQLCRKLK